MPETPDLVDSTRDMQTEVAITIGADGRLYCHDLTPDLLDLLGEICPNDRELIARRGVITQAELRDEPVA